MKTIERVLTISDATLCLPELVQRVHATGETALLVESGKQLARIVPVPPQGHVADLIAFLRQWRIEHPEPDEQFAEAIEESRQGVHPPHDPWE